MREWMMGLAGVALSLAGCRSNTQCDDLSVATEQYDDKARPCVQAGAPQPRFDVSECDEAFGQCSAEEKQVLADFARCLQDLPSCTPGSPEAFERALEECARAADTNLSGACGDPVLGLD